MVAAADINGGAAQLLQSLGVIDGVLNRHAARLIVGAAETDDQGEVLPHILLAAGKDLLQKTETVFPAATVPIGALVGKGGKEVGDEVAVGAMDLHYLKASVLGPFCGLSERLDNVMDLGDGQLFRNGSLTVALVHQRPGIGGSGLHGGAKEPLASAVLDLDAGDRPGILDAVSQPSQANDVFIVTDAQLVGCGLAVQPVHIGVLHDDHAYLALGQVLIVADQALRNRAIHVAQTRGLRGLADAVFDLYIADLAGGEKMGELIAHAGHSPLLFWGK